MICRVCGCTELDACDEGCAWVDADRDLCTSCADAHAGALLMQEAIVELVSRGPLSAALIRSIRPEDVARMARVIPRFEHEGVQALSEVDLRAVARVMLRWREDRCRS